MKYKIINDKGEEEEIEAVTPEEFEKTSTKLQELESQIKEKDEALNKALSEKQELESKVGDTKEDHPNFKILKDTLDRKTQEIDSLKNDFESSKKASKETLKESLLGQFVKGNKEVEDKINFHLENTLKGMSESTDKEYKEKLIAAVKLSADNASESPLNSVLNNSMGGGFNLRNGGSAGVEFTSKEKQLGAKLGITEEDYKKYGPKLTNK